MYGYLLQDWLTIRSTHAGTIVQSEKDWLALSSFQDVVFWVDVRELTPGSGAISLELQTAPIKEEGLFRALSNCTLAISSVQTPYNTSDVLPKTILANNPQAPLGTWVRWQLSNGTATGTWDITMRIYASANRVLKSTRRS